MTTTNEGHGLRAMPPGVAVFLAYAVLVLAGIALTLPVVIEQAVVIPISPIGVVAMGLLAYTIFTITLTLQRKEAARTLALGLASLTLPAVPLLFLGRLVVPAAAVALLAVALFVGLTRPSARRWLNER
ncbi:MAG TPA: hypothetical protein VFS32_07055 [Candidatus Limnocylindrales bacterium]|nr:hypothetical protein [Candidatus Limnocylindrales bacterium]